MMEKYRWSPKQIDEMEVATLIELEFGSWRNEEPIEEEAMIDSIQGFYKKGGTVWQKHLLGNWLSN